MKRKISTLAFLISIAFIVSCNHSKFIKQDKYIVLDKEGLSFTVYSSLIYKTKPNTTELNQNLKLSKSLVRKELGQYHIIESCIENKEIIVRELNHKIIESIKLDNNVFKYQIDSIFIDDFTKKTIVSKFGKEYELE